MNLKARVEKLEQARTSGTGIEYVIVLMDGNDPRDRDVTDEDIAAAQAIFEDKYRKAFNEATVYTAVPTLEFMNGSIFTFIKDERIEIGHYEPKKNREAKE